MGTEYICKIAFKSWFLCSFWQHMLRFYKYRYHVYYIRQVALEKQTQSVSAVSTYALFTTAQVCMVNNNPIRLIVKLVGAMDCWRKKKKKKSYSDWAHWGIVVTVVAEAASNHSQPYSTAGSIIVSHILILKFKEKSGRQKCSDWIITRISCYKSTFYFLLNGILICQ